jgi:D-glycero-D-manno-heptose 1,7-bisphosphate phosphatase
MIEQAVADLGLDVSRSFVVGDKWLDIGLANQAGARGILVRTGYGADNADEPPDGVQVERIVATLGEAADYILTTSESESAPHE